MNLQEILEKRLGEFWFTETVLKRCLGARYVCPGSVPLPSQDYLPVMRYSKGSKVRRILYTAYYTKNPENVDIFKEKKNEIMLRDLKMYA